MTERSFWRLLERLLVVVCATFWFGNTGFGLALLLLVARHRPSRIPDAQRLLSAEVISVWVGRERILVRCARQGRLEIYRDEVSEANWAAIRRTVLSQPATGRSTSI